MVVEHKVTHLDLCTGIGGFHLAAGWAGFETVGFSEIDPYCCRLLAEKWPHIKNYGDLRTADFSGLRGRITVLSAGVPCQPSSLAGKRRGASDNRWLWNAVFDVVRAVEPAWAIFENPPGILTLDAFKGVLLLLEAVGYKIRAFSVPANAVGAKHRRQRVFIVAHAERERCNGRTDGRGASIGAGASFEFMRAGSDAEALANAAQGGLRQPRQGARRSGLRSEEPVVADTARERLEEYESREQGQCSTALGGSGSDGFRLTEPPLCGAAPRVPNRSHRLKALGNSVVPAQAYPFFEAIAQVII